MKVYSASAYIRGGQLFIRRKEQLAQELLSWQDCECTLTVEKETATRSTRLNAYYWSVVVQRVAAKWSERLGRHVGPKETHEILKAQFLPIDLAERGVNGTLINGLVIGGSTAKLGSLRFIDYLERIVDHAAAHWDTYIPPPNPFWRQEAEALTGQSDDDDCRDTNV